MLGYFLCLFFQVPACSLLGVNLFQGSNSHILKMVRLADQSDYLIHFAQRLKQISGSSILSPSSQFAEVKRNKINNLESGTLLVETLQRGVWHFLVHSLRREGT